MGGAPQAADLPVLLHEAGFVDVSVEPQEKSREVIKGWLPGSKAEEYVVSAKILATKPASATSGKSAAARKLAPKKKPVAAAESKKQS